jgi:predicted enzyme related to lactoylglutathione lyase
MEKVAGIGGIFFKSTNPTALSAWYEKNLGITIPPPSYDDPDWQQESGPTVFAPMDKTSEHFQNDSVLSINFRVNNLNAMCAQLEAAAINVEMDPETYPNGRFASLNDPEGNQIQLWEVRADH